MNNRRDFLKKAGAGLALATFPGRQYIPTPAGQGNKQDIHTNSAGETEKIRVKVKKPLFCPYFNLSGPGEKGGGAQYFKSVAFEHNPFTVRAGGMSGSPVIVDADGKFAGFMTTYAFEDSEFSFDGEETLTIHVPCGQEVYINEDGDGNGAWKAYNSMMMDRLGIQPYVEHPDFWSDVEYCTWVEQKFRSKVPRDHFKLLNHDFVRDYLDRVIEYGYPKGKMTLDHGWGVFPDGRIDSGFGSWYPDKKLFPDFRKTMDMIREKGFTPGLWIGFPKIHAASLKAKESPNLLGSWETHAKEKTAEQMRYLNPRGDIYSYASDVIGRFHEMGVRKFKIDMSYNTKSDMLPIHKELYRAAKNIDGSIEMEFHVPDIFFAKFTDVIRTNDVWLQDNYDWPARVKMHYEVTFKSCPGRGINLDHIGGNATGAITEEKFLKHLEMYKSKTGYPLVSVLPHHFGKKCVEETGEYLWNYAKGSKNIISDFFKQG